MRETVITIEMKGGLRRDRRAAKNPQALIECRGLEPLESGLAAPAALRTPLAGFPASWPLPTLLRGERETLLGASGRLYTVDESKWLWTPVETLDPATGDERGLSGGGPWAWADFGTAWMATNGASVAWKRGGKVYAQDAIKVGAMSAFKGRAVLGGFDAGTFWSDEWKTWLRGKGAAGIALEAGAATVLWSSIGGGNMAWPFEHARAMTGPVAGSFDATRPLWLEELLGGDLGWMELPWQGTVYVLKQLGDQLIAYGNGGIAVLFAVVDPVPTLGMKHLAGIGVAGRGAVAGDARRHVFLDGAGCVWHIDAELKLTKLDYQEYMAELTGTRMVTYDPHEDRFFICGENGGFVLTSGGLARTSRRPAAIAARPEGSVAIDMGAASSELEIQTDAFDLGYRGLKHISEIEIGGRGLSDVHVCVDYLINNNTFFSSPWRPVNDQGWAMVMTAGCEYRIRVKGTAGTDAKLEYINVRWKALDYRGIRSEPTGGR